MTRPSSDFTPPERETGAALLAVLLLVAVMAALSVLALDRLRLATRLAANGAAADQAHAYALGAEALLMSRISALNGLADGRTPTKGNWMSRAVTMPIPGGVAVARIRDGGNCFNLNSLVGGTGDQPFVVRPRGVAQFSALMQVLGVPGNDAQSIAIAAADWIDADSSPLPGGAEDDVYAKGKNPYRAANQLIADPSELRAVAGVTPEIYALLRPWICALPVNDLSPINPNTLTPDQAPLVAMLLPGRIGVEQARQLIVNRPADGYTSVSEFLAIPALQGAAADPEVATQPQLKTRWFALRLDVDLAGAQVGETALVDAKARPARLVARSWGEDE